MSDVVVAITGASGALYAVRLLQVLLQAGQNVHLTISPAAVQVFHEELGISVDLNAFDQEQLLPSTVILDDLRETPDSERDTSHIPRKESPRAEPKFGRLIFHKPFDFSAGIASGSFQTKGMVICPCSMGTLGSLASGVSTNLIHRAAEVHLKERRKLILVPRETPLSTIHLENMRRVSEAGAVVLPAMPGFYHRPHSIQDIVDFVVSRICDQLGVQASLTSRWGEPHRPRH